MPKAINYRIVVKMLQNKDSLLQDDNAMEEAARLTVAEVKSIGRTACKEAQFGGAPEYKPGDLVYIGSYGGTIIPKKDGSYEKIINDSMVQGIVEEDDDYEALL